VISVAVEGVGLNGLSSGEGGDEMTPGLEALLKGGCVPLSVPWRAGPFMGVLGGSKLSWISSDMVVAQTP
jgi:hypothetical protein